MTAQIISLAEKRIERAQAGQPVDLTHFYLVQEAIDEFLASGEKFDLVDVTIRVREWEKQLRKP